MKVFLSTLGAILAAAVIIGFVFAVAYTYQARVKWDAEGRQVKQDIEFRTAEREYWEQKRKNPNFDEYDGQKLLARMAEIKDAIDNGKPIPPSHWQTETTPVQQPAPEIQSAATEYVTLNRDVEVAHGARKVVIPAGTTLPVVGRTSRTVATRFQNEVQFIPKSATSESK